MSEPQISPYGSWKSPITPDLILSATVQLGGASLDGEDIYWYEGRPTEGGRNVLVRRTPDGKVADINLAPFNARTRVHEYGGGSILIHEGTIFFSNFADQRIYRQTPGTSPQPITPSVNMRYADAIMDTARNRLICIREDHTEENREAVNTIVAISLDNENSGEVLVSGNDFYSNPRLNPDGTKLCWLTWNHPNMPWDGTELWVAEVTPEGNLANPTLVAGGKRESIFQPEWSPAGVLHFVSDRTNWWNLYRLTVGGEAEPLYPLEAEFGQPQWVFGMCNYDFISETHLLCIYSRNGRHHLATLDTVSGVLASVQLPYTNFGSIHVKNGKAGLLAGSPTIPASVILLDLASLEYEVIRKANYLDIDPGYISKPQSIEYPTEDELTAYAIYYPPKNKDFAANLEDMPPLLVKTHGGPTAATSTILNLQIQYWTSRGFAVLDVNYGGSTGYGRAYRERLNDKWGIVDMDDSINGAKYLVSQGLADSNRLAIDGGSAGGFTTLCALTFRDTFKAGASLFGVSDLEALAKDTHKFESRYLDNLIGPYPARRDLYLERSPIYHTELLSCPMILLQGLEDKVVPPSQAELMFEAVKKKGLPVAYIPFEGEQHGFRRAENIKRALEAEFYFYSKIFGFTPADQIEPVEIINL